LVAVVAQACAPMTADRLFSTLPREIDGAPLQRDPTTLDSLSGLAIDDVLTGLGKGRSDAAWVAAGVPGKVSVDVLAVSGVTSEQLARALVELWAEPSVVERRSTRFDSTSVTELRQRDGAVAFVYRGQNLAYVLTIPPNGDRSIVGRLIQAITTRNLSG
jgi:hypothetical protein